MCSLSVGYSVQHAMSGRTAKRAALVRSAALLHGALYPRASSQRASVLCPRRTCSRMRFSVCLPPAAGTVVAVAGSGDGGGMRNGAVAEFGALDGCCGRSRAEGERAPGSSRAAGERAFGSRTEADGTRKEGEEILKGGRRR